MRFDLKVFIPNLLLNGNYVMTGQVPLLPLSGVGTYKVFTGEWILNVRKKFPDKTFSNILDNVDILLKIRAHRVFKQGVPHLKISKIETDFQVKYLRFKLTESRSELLGE